MVHESLATSFLPVPLLQLSPSQHRAHGVQHRAQQTPEQLACLSAAGKEGRGKQGSPFPRHDSSHSHNLYPPMLSITGPKPLRAHLWVSTRHSQGNYNPPNHEALGPWRPPTHVELRTSWKDMTSCLSPGRSQERCDCLRRRPSNTRTTRHPGFL